MKTFAEWKAKFQLGTQIRQIWNSREGEVSSIFTVTKVQSNGVFGVCEGIPTRAWIPFPKRGEIVFTENGWHRLEGGQKLAEYVWIS